jgi:DNA-binding transcriptional ArsR family regulator
MDLISNQQQPVWRALFHPTRRQIVRLLQEKSRTTGELSNFFDVTRYAVMKHLRVLEQAELIHVHREGRLRWNVLNTERLLEVPDDYLDNLRSDELEDEKEDQLTEFEAGISSLEYQISLPVPANRVYHAFLHNIQSWWPRQSQPEKTMVLEPYVGGRFYQAFDEQGAGLLLGFITCLRPNEEIRILGPMDAEDRAATSTVNIRFQERDDQTQIHLTHRTVGEVDESLVSDHNLNWQERLDRNLRAFVTDWKEEK